MTKTKPKEAPKKKAATAPVAKKTAAPKAEAPKPPDQVTVAEATLKPADDDGGPNAKYPFGIQFTTESGFSYERYADKKKRDKRLEVVGKSDKVCAVKYTPQPGDVKPAPVVPESAQVIEGAPGAAKGKGPKLVPAAAANLSSINKRITPGARIDTWRVARSVRVGKPGFFLQGGFYANADNTGPFTVGEEEHFTDLRKARAAMVAKLPASDDIQEAPSPKTKAK